MRCGVGAWMQRWMGLAVAVMLGAAGQARGAGLQLNRYEPTPAGEAFLGVDAPWYRSTRLLAAGLTVDLGRDVLVGGTYDASGRFVQTTSVIENQLVGHVDLAVAPLDWLLISASLPVTLFENGASALGVSPISGMAVGDPRLGVDVRLLGHLERDPFSLHLAGRFWIPVGASANHAGDVLPRGAVEAIAGGRVLERLQWVANAGVLIRQQASLNGLPNGVGTTGSEAQVRAALAYVDDAHHFDVGVEGLFATGIGVAESGGSHLETMLTASYTVADTVQVGPGFGVGLLRGDGTPAWRALLRIAYAPVEPQSHAQTPPPSAAAVESDRDGDGVPDAKDLCSAEAAGAHPDPQRPGCPAPVDSDRDGVPDRDDLCPSEPAGPKPDSARRGCPAPEPVRDSDGDGVPDAEDACPNQPAGPNPDPVRRGCPAPEATPAPREHARPFVYAVPRESLPTGCQDEEAYPKGSRLLTIHFALNQAELTADARAQLRTLAKALMKAPEWRIEVDGFTDDLGPEPFNERLSERRAKAVADVLRADGVDTSRMTVRGLGSSRPLCTNASDESRAANRRAKVTVQLPE